MPNAVYDTKTERWTVTHDRHTKLSVSGPTREGCEKKLADLASRYRHIIGLR